MDDFIFDYTESDGGVTIAPIVGRVDGDVIFTEKIVAQNSIDIGNPAGGFGGGYSFPLTIGLNEYVLKSNITTNELVWAPNLGGGGGGDVINGGNLGPLTVGTLDNTPMNIISGGSINIGQIGVPDQIRLNGSIGFQYNNISSALGTLTLNADYYFVEISNSGTNIVSLPLASTAEGRYYIISKGFSDGTLQIIPNISDTIDGNASITLRVLNQRIKIISNGTNKWIIL